MNQADFLNTDSDAIIFGYTDNLLFVLSYSFIVGCPLQLCFLFLFHVFFLQKFFISHFCHINDENSSNMRPYFVENSAKNLPKLSILWLLPVHGQFLIFLI